MLPPKLQETLDDLEMLSDRQERIDYLIALAEEFRNPTGEELPRAPQTRVPGCESEAYVARSNQSPGFKVAVDNPQGISAMAMGLILEQGLVGAPIESIAEIPEDIVYRIFGNELSMGKSMGLTGMVRMVKTIRS